MNKRHGYWFLTGICSFSMALGLLIGVSQSTVVGVFITGVLGFAVGLGGTIFKKNETNAKQIISIDFIALGKSLFFFSLFLPLGVYLGSQYRASLFNKDSNEFIWTNETEPKTTYEALDWIMVNEVLSNKGFTKKQIQELFNLRTRELNDSSDLYFDSYDKAFPYYKVLIENNENLNSRKLDIPIPELATELEDKS